MPVWDEVANDPEFQSQAPEVKDRVRRNFFETEIAPNVPAQELESVRSSFLSDTERVIVAPPPDIEPEPAPEPTDPVQAAGQSLLEAPGRAFRTLRGTSEAVAAPIAAPIDRAIRAVDEPFRRVTESPYFEPALDVASVAVRRGAEKLGLGRYEKDVAAGALGTVAGVAGAARAFGFENAGKMIATAVDKTSKELLPPDPAFADQVASGLGSMAAFMVPGYGVQTGAAHLAAFAPRMASLLGVSTSAALESAVEGGEAYNQVMADTGDVQQAQRAGNIAFWANLPLVAFTNKMYFPGEGRFKGGTGYLGFKAIEGALTEGSQEASQAIIGNYAAKDPIMQGVLESFGVGAITGGVAGPISDVAGRLPAARPEPQMVPAGPPPAIPGEAVPGPQMTNPVPPGALPASAPEAPPAPALAPELPPAVQEVMERTGITDPEVAEALATPPEVAQEQPAVPEAPPQAEAKASAIQEVQPSEPQEVFPGLVEKDTASWLEELLPRIPTDIQETEAFKSAVIEAGSRDDRYTLPQFIRELQSGLEAGIEGEPDIPKNKLDLLVSELQETAAIPQTQPAAREPAPAEEVDETATEEGDISFFEPEPAPPAEAKITPADLREAEDQAKREIEQPPYDLSDEELARRLPEAPKEALKHLYDTMRIREQEYNEAQQAEEFRGFSPTPLRDMVRSSKIHPSSYKVYLGEWGKDNVRGLESNKGMPVDLLRQEAIEFGILPEDATINDFWEQWRSEVALGPKKGIKLGKGFEYLKVEEYGKAKPSASKVSEPGPPAPPKPPRKLRIKKRKVPLRPEETKATMEAAGIKPGSEHTVIRGLNDPIFGRIKKGEKVKVIASDLEGGNLLIERPGIQKYENVAIIPIEAVAAPVRAEKVVPPQPSAVAAKVAEATGVKPAEKPIPMTERKALKILLQAQENAATKAKLATEKKARNEIKALLNEHAAEMAHGRKELRENLDWNAAAESLVNEIERAKTKEYQARQEKIRSMLSKYVKLMLPTKAQGLFVSRISKAKTGGDQLKVLHEINQKAFEIRNKETIEKIRVLVDRMLESKTFPVDVKAKVREVFNDINL